ncbi:Glyoxalase/bleomycin resistance protein/dioxygenase (fragment) [Paraburkholderia piptadeniae]|uniref:Glyoxalase/bleomycin resistance protein/dioxygenase n=1 Tax=Paraburkholderia piptadeniae TaxID=1701573 RepID=A0A1N7SG46_9BURK
MRIQFAELPVVNGLRARKFYTRHFDYQVADDRPMLQGNEDNRWLIRDGRFR